MLRTNDLDYHLPEALIATQAAEPRESARLMVVRKGRWGPGLHASHVVEHRRVADLPELLAEDDLLVMNSTRVLPARFEGVREDSGGAVEGLYLQPGPEVVATGGEGGLRHWIAMLQMRRHTPGAVIVLHDRVGRDAGLRLRLVQRMHDEQSAWLVRVEAVTQEARSLLAGSDAQVLEAIGRTPLPPYIRAARKRHEESQDDHADRERYQTVYAGHGQQELGGPADESGVPTTGSVAAPTAGLHLTPQLLADLSRRGVREQEVVLHVGMGTFRGVESEFVEQHRMHVERCAMSPRALEAVLDARRGGPLLGRVIAVGTTSARTLESYARVWDAAPAERRTLHAMPPWLDTNLLITPGYRWRWVDGLLTNFHLPRSTLMAMVGSLLEDAAESGPGSALPEGVRRLKELYELAVAERYRFYSFGDAMLILP